VSIQVINPLSDGRWDDLVARHPKASVFHECGWLQALARTYGYRPFVLTSARAGAPLTDGIVLCRISSWITGNRAVSLPFADHCEPLLEGDAAFLEFANWLRTECDGQRWKYVELRPLSWSGAADGYLPRGRSYCFHTLDLTSTLEEIFQRLHKDSIQRKIRRAERERLSYETGRTEQLLDDFYQLLLKTRRRHRMLPQPRAWYRNLADCMGDKMQVRLARKDGVSIAAMLTLRRRSCMVYKYGCSDDKFHNLGGVPFLFWKLIEESKASDINEIDFGRSDLDNDGLIIFKDRFGTTRKRLTYVQYPQAEKGEGMRRWDMPALRRVLSILPEAVVPMASGLLYKHIG
jgi:CelD/BcsL family acetyltransferase involved in cellulose biosynthesis